MVETIFICSYKRVHRVLHIWMFIKSTMSDQTTRTITISYNIGAQTWALAKQTQHTLAAVPTNMERSMLDITCKDRNANIVVRTKVIDIISNVRNIKWSWAEHIDRLKDERCTSRVTNLITYDTTKMTKETSQAVERRPWQILEAHNLGEDSERQANLEAACWGQSSETFTLKKKHKWASKVHKNNCLIIPLFNQTSQCLRYCFPHAICNGLIWVLDLV